MRNITFLLGALSLLFTSSVFAQGITLTLATDTSVQRYPERRLVWQGREYFYLEPAAAQVEYALSVAWADQDRILAVDMLPSRDYELTDSIRVLDAGEAVGKIRFFDLEQTLQPRLIFSVLLSDSSRVNRSILLYPFFAPRVEQLEVSTELFRDEEKIVVLPVENPRELIIPRGWRQEENLQYRLFLEGNQLKAALKDSRIGEHSFTIPLRTRRPFLDASGLPTQELGGLPMTVEVKPSPLSFLNLDRKDVFFEPMGQVATLVQLDRVQGLQLSRTYRIEDQEGPGGRLVAELFTRSYVDNQQKILAVLRTYALHREEEGYLYLKSGEQSRFFTNFNILSKPKISKVSVLRAGKDWTTSLAVYPGESLEVKVEGEGLEKAQFMFGEGRFLATLDTARRSDLAQYYQLTIPIDVKETRIPLSMNGKPSSFELLVREYQSAADLDFVNIDYGAGMLPVTAPRFDKPATFEGEIRDITFSFRPHMLDTQEELHGIQYLEIELRVTGPDKRLIEIREINDLKITPAPVSPRYAFYNRDKATDGVIRLNDYLANKTYDWKPWTQLEITIRHKPNTYGAAGQTRKLILMPSQRVNVQLEVSFPAGLLTKRFNQPGIGNLTGISTAALVQASFYQPGKINKLSPWKVGGGFLALNALSSLTDNDEDKDLGVLGMVSFYPINSDSKVKFPLHAGLGYLFKNNTLFLVVGPGVQVNF
ncbi:MAG: hypothetical protein AAFQ98_02835 [Bacteroidota bacterium]